MPGGHRWLNTPPPAGSVFLFNGATWQATGSNEAGGARVCLICFGCRSVLKPMFDYERHTGPAVAAWATEEMGRIYGIGRLGR